MAPAVADEDAEAEGPVLPAGGVLETQAEAGLGPAVIRKPELKQRGGHAGERGRPPGDRPGQRGLFQAGGWGRTPPGSLLATRLDSGAASPDVAAVETGL